MDKSESGPRPNLEPVEQLEIGVGFESLFDSDTDWAEVAANMDRADVGSVSIAVGRPEWVAFPWRDHEDSWSPGATEMGSERDRVAEIIGYLIGGRDRELTLTIDALSPRTIEDNPELGGVFADGSPSPSFPSAEALHTGEVGEEIEALCAETAARYRPTRIALTELIGDAFFGDNDRALYESMTGNSDFPRTDDDDIDTEDEELRAWQSEIIEGVVQRCQSAVADHGTDVQMDVRANWDQPGADRLDSGHNYSSLLESGAELTVWAYFGLQDRTPEESQKIVNGLSGRFTDEELRRVTLSYGLWEGDEDTVSASDLADALDAVERGPGTIAVTPLSMISDNHWDVLFDNPYRSTEPS